MATRRMILPEDLRTNTYSWEHNENAWCKRMGCLPVEAKAKEPTLDCSEVVERLPMSAKEFAKTQKLLLTCDALSERAADLGFVNVLDFAESYATAILHSWREQIIKETK